MPTSPLRMPSLRPIARKQWAIPLPDLSKIGWEDRPVLASSSSLDYDKACEELKELGFSCVYSCKSISHSRMEYLRDGEESPPLDEHALWFHPAGVIVRTRSYESGGYTGAGGHYVPKEVVADTLDTYVEVDAGAGSEVGHIAGVKISGSGSSTLMFDGTFRRLVHASSARGSQSFVEFLTSCQKYGRLVPLEEWTPRTSPYLPSEMLFPITDAKPWRGKKVSEEEKDPNLLQAVRDEMAQSMPPEVFAIISRYWIESNPVERIPSDEPSRGEMDWTTIEYAHTQVGEALSLSRQRFPSSQVRSHVQHWLEVAKGWHGDNMDNWRAFEPGPAGLSLATVLLFSNRRPENQARLLRLIEDSPLENLHTWLQEPDAAGYVLGQRILVRAFSGSAIESMSELEGSLVEVVDALLARVGPEAIRMTTQSRSALGAWLQTDDKPSGSEIKNFHDRQNVAASLLLRMADAGVEWKSPVRWRTYPNVFTSADKIPRFKQLGSTAPTADEWKAAMGERQSSGATIAHLLQSQELDANLPKSNPSRRTARRF